MEKCGLRWTWTMATGDKHLILRILAVLIAVRFIVNPASGSSEKDVVDHILGDPKSQSRIVARPLRNASHSMQIYLRVLFAQMIELDEPKQQLTLNTWQKMSWKDEYMVWNPDDYDGLDIVYVLPSQIWTPRLVLLENANFYFTNINQDVLMSITADGTVTWYTLAMSRVSCKVHTRLFPFDVQKCTMTFMSWSYDLASLNILYFDDEDSKQTVFHDNGIWRLNDVDVERVEKEYLCCVHPYPQIIYTLTLKRQSDFYIYSVMVPSVLLTVITLMVFLMPPESGEKISLGITNLLACILFQQLIAGNMPPQGDELPIVSVYLFSMVIIGCASILESVFVLRLFHKPEDEHVPRAVAVFSTWVRRRKSPVTWQSVAKAVDKTMLVVFSLASGAMMFLAFIVLVNGEDGHVHEH